jgi:23S rRNA pseudouridine1911/1915/1917 synthase
MAVTPKGKPAVTHYRVLKRFSHNTFIAVRLETGRTHQIRVHMAKQQRAIVGDPLYGGRLQLPAGADEHLVEVLRKFRRQALHASHLNLSHPVSGEPLSFRAPLPEDFQQLLGALSQEGVSADDWDSMVWPDSDSTAK